MYTVGLPSLINVFRQCPILVVLWYPYRYHLLCGLSIKAHVICHQCPFWLFWDPSDFAQQTEGYCSFLCSDPVNTFFRSAKLEPYRADPIFHRQPNLRPYTNSVFDSMHFMHTLHALRVYE